MERHCKTCRFYGDSGSGDPGYCLWGKTMPPVIREMLRAMEAEPAARIKHTVFDGMEISVKPGDTCSAHAFA